jgi:ABC-type transport system involved in multi-copper enzyme maturation permease subunit
MSAVTAPAPPVTRPRPVPWTGLVWVTWRQHRGALMGVAALLGALALYLLIMALKIHSAYQAVASCHPLGSAACEVTSKPFSGYYHTAQDVTVILQVIPVLVGVFAGAPLLARELETGTFRFAWTQGCGRLRWVVAKLAVPAIAITAAAGAFSLLYSWYYQPFFAERLDGVLAPQLFNLRGVGFAAWTLAAFAIGAIAGVLIKRTVPAMAASLAAWAGLDLATALFLRKHYQAGLLVKGSPSYANPPWVVGQWYTGPNGATMSQQTIRDVVQHAPASVRNSLNPNAAADYLSAHHYTLWSIYQPESRFWHFQLIEGGWLLALSVILLAATVWLVRHRAA